MKTNKSKTKETIISYDNKESIPCEIRFGYEGIQMKIMPTNFQLFDTTIKLDPYRIIYKPKIFFKNNQFIVGEDDGISMFDKDFFDKSNQNNTKECEFFGKKYQLNCAEFVALYFAQFFKIVKRIWKVRKVLFETRKGLQSFNDILSKGIQLLGISKIRINGKKQKILKLSPKESSQINEILQIQEEFQIIHKQFIRLQQQLREERGDKHMDILSMDVKDIDKEKSEKIKHSLTPEERSRFGFFLPLDDICIYEVSKYFDSTYDFCNCEIATRKCFMNLFRFKYNPVPITYKTREMFPNLQLLHIFNPSDDKFLKDNRIKSLKYVVFEHYNLIYCEKKQLEKWTHLQCSEVLFDSNVDNWSIGTSVFHSRIWRKKQITILIETDDGIKFGCYIDATIDNWRREVARNNVKGVYDDKAFLFTFKDNNPKKVCLKSSNRNDVFFLYKPEENRLFWVGIYAIGIMKYGNRCQVCQESDDIFYFDGGRNMMIGRTGGQCLQPRRIIVIR